MQLVDTLLQKILDGRRCLDASVVNRNQQGFDFMAEVAHGRNAGHTGPALQRVQVALELLHRLRGTLLDPLEERLVGRFEQLGRLLREYRRDFRIVLGLVADDLGHVLVSRRSRRNRRGCRFGRHRRHRGLRLHGIGQLVDVLDQRRVIGTIPVRVVDIADDGLDRPGPCTQRIEARFLESDLVVVDATYETIQRGGHGHAAFDIGHVCAAVQRVARTIQLVGHVEGRTVPFAGFEVVRNDLEMARGLFREDVVQHGIHFERGLFRARPGSRQALDLQHGGVRISLGKGVGTRYQQADIGCRFRADLELLDKLGNSRGRLDNEIHHRRRPRQRPVDEAIEQVFDRPAILADSLGTDHAPASLERVEGTSHRDERLEVVRRRRPRRQVPPDRRDFFLGFLDEELEELGIEVFGPGRHDRQRHDFGGLRRLRRTLRHCRLARRFDFERLDFLRRRSFLRLFESDLLQAILDIPQHSEAGLRIVKHVPGFAAACLHGLHVVLDTDDGVSQPIRFLLRENRRPTGIEHGRHEIANAIHDFLGSSLVEHEEAGLDSVDQRRDVVEPG